MSPAEDVFFGALQRATPQDRAAYLDEACAGRPELRARVERLLAAHPRVGEFLEPGAEGDAAGMLAAAAPGATASHRPAAEAEGTVVAGRYKLLQQIGEGGMGSVWMADQTEPVKRRVAVKLIRTERGQSKTILSRFEAERQAIALMDHPHIAKLLDAGTTDTGSPFFVMELVKGIPLNEYCDAHKLSIPDRLQLFTQICSAVQHAHQKGVIHRDLKPSNVLVESHDGKPVPKVIDFGLAKATSGLQLSEHTLFTAFGSVMGTPLYMAPEQANFNAVDVDTRADVYALGVILYELLTGTTPLTRETAKKAALDEMLKLIREQEAPTPSRRLSTTEGKPTIAANRQTEPQKLSRFVRGELDWIVMKALSKERERRYETANGFARDVERFLNQEPLQAGPPGASYRFRKFVQRNRGQVIASSLVLLALVVGVVGTTSGLIRADQQRQLAEANEKKANDSADAERLAKRDAETRRDEAIAERKRADEEAAVAKAVNDFLNQDLLVKGNPDAQAADGHPYDKNVTLRAVVDRAAARIDERFADQPLVAAAVHKSVAAVYAGLDDNATALRHSERGWELTRAARGDDHRETLTAVNAIGASLLNMSEYGRAEARFKENYERARRLFGEDDEDTLLYLNNLAAAYSRTENWKEAQSLLRVGNDALLRKFGESDVRSLPALLAKARDLAAVRKIDESDDVTRRAFELARNKLPAYHRELVDVTEAWVQVLIRRGQKGEAEALAFSTHENCLKQFKAIGTGSTYLSGKFLARTYLSLGKPAAAEPVAVDLVAVARRGSNGNPSDADLCESRSLLISVYLRQRKWDSAEPLLVEQSEHDRSRREGARFTLGTAYTRQGKHAAAEPIIRERFELVKKNSGDESAQYADALADLMRNQLAQRKWAEAEQLAHELLALREKSQPDGWLTFNTRSLLGGALLGQKKYADAEPLLLKGYEGLKQREKTIPPFARERVPEALDRLIDLYTVTNKPDEAKKYQAERAKYPAEKAPPPRDKK
jgi:non-specific serine/threonine protein kinase/serine/threonine-protein kinase